jgi:hypothetical protein
VEEFSGPIEGKFKFVHLEGTTLGANDDASIKALTDTAALLAILVDLSSVRD